MLSIVVTVYNGEAYIGRCLNSIYGQSFKDYEVICVDDGSTDNSYHLIQRMKRQNMKIIHTENRGVWFARKEGIRMASGEWIGFVDCDDEIMENMYADMMARTENKPDIDMVVCGFKKVDALTGKVFSVQMVGFGDKVINVKTNKEILAAVNPSMCNKIFRTHVIRQSIELDHAPRIMEDFILIGSIYPSLHNVAFCKIPYYLYYDNRGSVTKCIGVKDLKNAENAILQLKEYYKTAELQDRNLLELLAVIHIGVAFTINMNQYGSGETTHYVWRHIYKFLDDNFGNWKKNSYMICKNYIWLRQLWKVYLIYSLFKRRIFMVTVWVYHFLISKLNVDIKW